MDEIGSPTRRCDDEEGRIGISLDSRPDLCQPIHGGTVGVDHPGHPVGKIDSHPDRRRGEIGARRIPAPIGERGPHCATGDFGQQCRGAVDGGHRDRRVHRPLVASAGLADQMQPAHRARYRGGIPHRGFQQHIGGVGIDLGATCAHHTADRGHGYIVDDQHIARFEGAFDVIEGDHGLPRCGEPDRELAVDSAAVVGVHGVTEFEHHVVGDVDGRGDRPDTGEHQPTAQPPGRHRCRIDPGHRAQGESADAGSGLDRHR